MKSILLLITLSCGLSMVTAQHTVIEHESTTSNPQIDLIQTSTTDQYSRIWFTNTTSPDDIWSIRAGSNSNGDSDFDIRYKETGQVVKSLMQLDGVEKEAIFSTDILADGKGIFHRTDNLTQSLDLITSGANADSKLRIGSGGGLNAQVGWDPGDNALKLIPDAFSFTNGGLIIKDADPGVRYGFNAAPQDDHRISVAYDSQNFNEGHINLNATGSTDYARIKFTNNSDAEWGIAGGSESTSAQMHFSYSSDAGTSSKRLLSLLGDKDKVRIRGTLVVTDSLNLTTSDINLYNASDARTVWIDASDTQLGGRIHISKSDGNSNLKMDADWNGTGLARIITDELELNGGSDFAENFDITSHDNHEIKAGYIVSINPSKSGQLQLTSSSYDRKVAGIISGANGIRPGLMMGQDGSIADGEYPVALTGRVYVHANQENGEIVPGDLLTSSKTVGEAMRASNSQLSFGAIIGKAMTTIDENGYVLVLVNLQ